MPVHPVCDGSVANVPLPKAGLATTSFVSVMVLCICRVATDESYYDFIACQKNFSDTALHFLAVRDWVKNLSRFFEIGKVSGRILSCPTFFLFKNGTVI